MALIEVDSDEYSRLVAELQTARPSKALLDRLGNNAKTRRQVLQLYKEVDPNASIPEIDAASPVLEEVNKTRAEMAVLQKKLDDRDAAEARATREREVQNSITLGQDRLRTAGWTDEGITNVEKLMQDRGLTDYEAAAALFERSQPKDEPVMPSDFGRNWDLFAAPSDNEDIKAAVSLPRGAAQEQALRRWQSKEINNWFAENRGTHNVLRPGLARR